MSVTGQALWDVWLAEGRAVWKELGRDPAAPLDGPEPQFVTYRERWALQFDRSFRTLTVVGDAASACDSLRDLLSKAPCYPEVPEVLAALSASHRLAILSNADDDFLSAFLSGQGLIFETVVSSESARSSKPRSAIFQKLCATMALEPPEVLYVGDSPIPDLLGARAAGMSVAWINRDSAKLPENVPKPDLEIQDLRGLLDLTYGNSTDQLDARAVRVEAGESPF